MNVFRNGKHIANSPFKINVGEAEIGNAGKVKVYGKGLEEGMANEVNEFIVDTREAGELKTPTTNYLQDALSNFQSI